MNISRATRIAALAVLLAWSSVTTAADWPMWRGDAGRSGATSEGLPGELNLLWSRRLSPLTPAWEEDRRLYFDAGYEPVAAHGLLFIASSHNDSLTAFQIDSGEEHWRFHAGGPVRFAPVVSDGLLFFGADDGCFYCLDAKTGEQKWRFLAAPNRRKAIGNARMTSIWPVRGGAVLHQGRVSFTAGVWPFEGTFLYSFDIAGAGDPTVCEASADGQPTPIRDSGLPGLKVETLSDITPQGYLVGTHKRLYVPCGRSKVLTKDLSTGDLKVPGYSTGDSSSYHVSATDRFLFHGGVSVDMDTSGMLATGAGYPVFDSTTAYFGKAGSVVAFDLVTPQEVISKDRRGRDVRSTQLKQLWELQNRAIHDVPAEPEYEAWVAKNPLRLDLKAGERLYGHQGSRLFALELSEENQAPQPVWSFDTSETPRTMIPADGRLIVVTKEGTIRCFGESAAAAQELASVTSELPTTSSFADTATEILQQTGVTTGYCLAVGIGSGELISELLRQSDLHVVAIDPGPEAVQRLRSQLDASGHYGSRVSAMVGNLETAQLPPFFASLVVSETLGTGDMRLSNDLVRAVYRSTRPYGGSWMLNASSVDLVSFSGIVEQLELPGADVQQTDELVRLTRRGRLPGSADWTHEYGDPANTLMSHDRLVKAPLGVLWFGGPSSSGQLFYNRHFWGPSMAVIGGRMFVQGPSSLAAIDVYTGRVLWKQPLEDTEDYRPGRRGNDFEGHLSGFHFLAVEDSLYLVLVDRCVRLDPATGATLAELRLPNDSEDWGRIRVEGDLLITEVFGDTEKFGRMPVAMAALDRQSGELRWRHDAELSYPVSAVSGDLLYCFDGALQGFYKDWERKGVIPKAAERKTVVAIDLKTGEEKWRVPTDRVLTWLAFSSDQDTLIASNKESISAFDGKDGYLLWSKQAEGQGFRGHPETLWDKVILWNDQILDQRGPGLAYKIRTGESIERVHPMTQQPVDWEFTKSGHHCNYAIANPHLMTFRADTAGFCDIESGTTARLQGYRPGCRNSLIPANGVLNSPNFAHGCVCGYPLFTSLALVHRPDAELWTYSPLSLPEKDAAVQRLAINFGAPGDRQVREGSLWLGYPNTQGSSPDPGIQIEGPDAHYFRDHSSLLDGDERNWIVASGVEGASKVTVKLNNAAAQQYSLTLLFRDPNGDANPLDRVFGVRVQGEQLIDGLDLVAESPGSTPVLVKVLDGIEVAEQLELEFSPTAGQPVLCGLELVAVP